MSIALVSVAPDLEVDPAGSPTWAGVCRLAELELFWGEAALLGGQQIALFLLPDDRVAAVSNRDPATGAHVISRGIVGSRRGRPTIASPLHKDVYDLQTGECYTTPELHLTPIPVRVRSGIVEVALRTRVSAPAEEET